MSRKELGRQLAREKMAQPVEIIRKVLDTFTDESEYFLCPMYILTAQAMSNVMHQIGDRLESQKDLHGSDVLRIIADCFQTEVSRLTTQLEILDKKNGVSPEKSHNEELTEKLLKEAGL